MLFRSNIGSSTAIRGGARSSFLYSHLIDKRSRLDRYVNFLVVQARTDYRLVRGDGNRASSRLFPLFSEVTKLIVEVWKLGASGGSQREFQRLAMPAF